MLNTKARRHAKTIAMAVATALMLSVGASAVFSGHTRPVANDGLTAYAASGAEATDSQPKTLAQKIQDVKDAKAALEQVKADAEAMKADMEANPDSPRENYNVAALESRRDAACAVIDSYNGDEEILNNNDATEAWNAAINAEAPANSAVFAVQEAILNHPTQADLALIPELKQKFNAVKTLADAAKAAADEGNATLFHEKYDAAVEMIVAAYDLPRDNWEYVSEKTDTEATAASAALSAAWDSFETNVKVASDKADGTGTKYTSSEIECIVSAKKETTVPSGKDFAFEYDVKWQTKSGGKQVWLLPGESWWPDFKLGAVSTFKGAISSCDVFFNTTGGTALDSSFNDDNGSYYASAKVHDTGKYIVTGKCYAADIFAKDIDTGKTLTKENAEASIQKALILKTDPWYQEIVALLPSSVKDKVLAIRDIYIFDGTDSYELLPGKKLTVSLQIDELKGKTIDIYHITWDSNASKEVAKLVVSGVKVGTDGKFSFVADGFSPYVFTESTSTDDSSGSSSGSSSNSVSSGSPNTGEGSPLPFILIAVGALGAAAGVIVWRKKKGQNQ